MMSVPQQPSTAPTPKIVWKSESRYEPQSQRNAEFASERKIARSDLTPFVTVRESAWQRLWRHARSADVEVGGVLVGEVFSDPESGQLLVDVQAAIPARGAHETGAYFKLTEEAWDHISRERDQRFPVAEFPHHLIVGWYHTHPGLGVFYSGTDKASQKAFFARPWNFGIVLDPAQERYGVFLGGESRSLPLEHLVTYRDPAAPQSPVPATTAMISRELESRATANVAAVSAAEPRRLPPVPAIAATAALLLTLWIARRYRGATPRSRGALRPQAHLTSQRPRG